jgi:hypothetical protein
MAIDWLPLQNAGNFADRILYSNCARPWWVYVETFFPSYLKLVLTLGTPDLNDLVRARASQIAGPGRVGSHWRKRKVTGREPKHKRYSMNGLKWLLILTEPLELIGFTWLLYSATDEFFLDWMTLIEKTEYCTDPSTGGAFHRSRIGGPTVISPIGSGVSLPNLEFNPRNWITDNFGLRWPAGGFKVVLACKVSARLGVVPDVCAALQVVTPFGSRFFYGEKRTCTVHEVTTIMVDLSWHRAAFGMQELKWLISGPPVLAGLWVWEADVTVFKFD